MRLLFDILLGVGLGAAIGLRPFLPVLLIGAAATADLRLDFDGTDFAFLESPVFLVVIAVAGTALFALERRDASDAPELSRWGQGVAGLALGLAAVVFAGALDDDGYLWWPGILGGLAVAFLAQAASRGIFTRVRARLDPDARAALPVYAEGAALLAAALVLLFPPLAVLVLAFLARLLVGGRRREGEKYAGLRILR